VVRECQSGVEQVGTGVNNSDFNSNIGRDIGYPDRLFHGCLQSDQENPAILRTLSYIIAAALFVISVPLLSVQSMSIRVPDSVVK